jgi:hypothetical protein
VSVCLTDPYPTLRRPQFSTRCQHLRCPFTFSVNFQSLHLQRNPTHSLRQNPTESNAHSSESEPDLYAKTSNSLKIRRERPLKRRVFHGIYGLQKIRGKRKPNLEKTRAERVSKGNRQVRRMSEIVPAGSKVEKTTEDPRAQAQKEQRAMKALRRTK